MNTQMDKISVIVPVYRVEEYLDRCIESIVRQTYQNLEIILIDDGSPDRCGQICDEWKKQDSRIRVIHKENGGLASARNAGLDLAGGCYIGFVDSDDLISPYMYEELHRQITAYDADMVFCEFQNFVKEEELHREVLKQERVNRYSVKDAFYRLYAPDCDRMNLAWNKLYKRELFNEIRYPLVKTCEDAAVIHSILEACSSIVSDENVLYFRQRREDSIMGAYKTAVWSEHYGDILRYMKDRTERYAGIEDRNLAGCICADYYQTLIVMYTRARKYSGSPTIPKELHREFCASYSKIGKTQKFGWRKRIKYSLFYRCRSLCYFLMLHDRKNF